MGVDDRAPGNVGTCVMSYVCPVEYHRQFHSGEDIICRLDREVWPCRVVRATATTLEGLSERCQYVCPWCADFVWMQVQDGEMWCPNGDCGYYASQFALLGMLFDPSLADVRADIAELSQRVK
jgi:hypothetical protein